MLAKLELVSLSQSSHLLVSADDFGDVGLVVLLRNGVGLKLIALQVIKLGVRVSSTRANRTLGPPEQQCARAAGPGHVIQA